MSCVRSKAKTAYKCQVKRQSSWLFAYCLRFRSSSTSLKSRTRKFETVLTKRFVLIKNITHTRKGCFPTESHVSTIWSHRAHSELAAWMEGRSEETCLPLTLSCPCRNCSWSQDRQRCSWPLRSGVLFIKKICKLKLAYKYNINELQSTCNLWKNSSKFTSSGTAARTSTTPCLNCEKISRWCKTTMMFWRVVSNESKERWVQS